MCTHTAYQTEQRISPPSLFLRDSRSVIIPFEVENIDLASTGGLSGKAQNKILKFREESKKVVEDLGSGRTFIHEGLLDEADRARAGARIEAEFDSLIKNEVSNRDKIVNIVDRRETARGMEFDFTITDQAGDTVKGTFSKSFQLNDVGHWEQISSNVVGELISSPKARAAGTDLSDLASAAIRLDNATATVGVQLRKLLSNAIKPVKKLSGRTTRRRLESVDAVLIYGDEVGEVFTPTQLRAGINGIPLDDEQIEVYYNVRALYDALGTVRNGTTRASMVARNTKTIFFNGKAAAFGTVADTAANARRVLSSNDNIRQVRRVDSSKKKGVSNEETLDVRDLDLDQQYSDGYRLVRLEDTRKFGDAGRFSTVLMRQRDIRQLPQLVLARNKGYVPRISKDASFFVQAFIPSSIDGSISSLRRVVRGFDNKREADIFRDRMGAELEAGASKFAKGTQFESRQDREIELLKAGDTGQSSTGGLFYGPRRGEAVPFGLPEDELVNSRFTAFESLGLYLENVKGFVTRNEWRMGARQKWLNTARRHTGNRNVDFDTFADESTDIGRALTAWRNQINVWSGFNSKSENFWDTFARQTYEWALGKTGRNGFTKFLHSFRHKDPVAGVRSAAFHSLLGFFNPAQLWVQAQGASVALSMNIFRPDKVVNILTNQLSMRMVQHVERDSKTFNALARASGRNPDKLRKEMELWDRTGLNDSLLTNADVEAAARGFPVASSAVRKFADSGLLFYREGEGMNRRISFLTALGEMGGVAKITSLADLKRLTTRTNDLLLSMGRANRAAWQNGPLSVPTQFFQVQAKTLESVLGRNQAFTPFERFKLVLGQVSLYGAAGIPAGSLALRWGMDQAGMTTADINNPDNEATLKAINGGFWDFMAFYGLGADTILSDRGALLNGLDRSILSFTGEEKTAVEFMLGPSFTPMNRFWQKLNNVWPLVISDVDNIEWTTDKMLDGLSFLAEDLGELALSPISTYNQSERYMFMSALNQIVDRNGNQIVGADFNRSTEILAALGFKAGELQRTFDLTELNDASDDFVSAQANAMIYTWNKFFLFLDRVQREGREPTESELSRFRNARDLILSSVENPILRRDILRQMNNRLQKQKLGESKLDREVDRFYRRYLDELYGEAVNVHTRVTRTNR